MEGIIMHIISGIIIVFLFALQLFSKRVHYIVSGLSLISLGILLYLYENYYIDFNISSFPAISFALYFILFFAGKDLFAESFKEESSSLKYMTLFVGILIIIMTTIPTLNKMGVIGFDLPEYPRIVDSIIYIIAGITLIIGVFVLLNKE